MSFFIDLANIAIPSILHTGPDFQTLATTPQTLAGKMIYLSIASNDMGEAYKFIIEHCRFKNEDVTYTVPMFDWNAGTMFGSQACSNQFINLKLDAAHDIYYLRHYFSRIQIQF